MCHSREAESRLKEYCSLFDPPNAFGDDKSGGAQAHAMRPYGANGVTSVVEDACVLLKVSTSMRQTACHGR